MWISLWSQLKCVPKDCARWKTRNLAFFRLTHAIPDIRPVYWYIPCNVPILDDF